MVRMFMFAKHINKRAIKIDVKNWVCTKTSEPDENRKPKLCKIPNGRWSGPMCMANIHIGIAPSHIWTINFQRTQQMFCGYWNMHYNPVTKHILYRDSVYMCSAPQHPHAPNTELLLFFFSARCILARLKTRIYIHIDARRLSVVISKSH